MQDRVEVFVATHKKILKDLPEGYIKAQVNCANSHERWDGYAHDDSGENISLKNPNYSELSVMYWAWKNSDADIKGLVHYRRMFSKIDTCQYIPIVYGDLARLEQRILKKREILTFLKDDFDVLLAMPDGPNPLNALEELKLFVYDHDIQIMEDIMKNEYADYYPTYKSIMSAKHLSYFNMIITRKDIFDEYCAWIFEILAKIEEKCDLSGYDTQHKRIYGYLSEVLQNVFIEKKKLRKKYFVLLQPYQMKDISAESYNGILKREQMFDRLRRFKLGFIEDTYYKLMHKDMYDHYKECVKYLKTEREK